MSDAWENTPATEKQKEKLRYFGCSWDEGINKKQASDALDECAKQFPEKNAEYYCRPATKEQLAKLQAYLEAGGEELDDFADEIKSLTYSEAKDWIREYELDERNQAQDEEGGFHLVNAQMMRINLLYEGDYREVTYDEVAKALDLLKSRQTEMPDSQDLLDALEELFSDFRPKEPDPFHHDCKQCGGKFKIRLPERTGFSFSSQTQFTQEDIIPVTVKCPHCGNDTKVASLHICKFVCPKCATKCSAAKSMAGQRLRCLKCREDFVATSGEPIRQLPKVIALPLEVGEQARAAGKPSLSVEGPRMILEKKLSELIADGVCDESDEKELKALSVQLGLDESFSDDLLREKFTEEFLPIQRRAEKAHVLTDEDVEAIERLKKKYAIQLTLEGNAAVFRSIFMIESKKQLPAPISTDLMLNKGEVAYHSIHTSWHQLHVQKPQTPDDFEALSNIAKIMAAQGLPWTPGEVTNQVKEIADGVLYVTSERLLFSGTENHSINLKKIVNGQFYSDFLKIEKSAGKSDLFSMTSVEARYVLALIRALKEL